MKTDAEKIKVMEAHLRGEKIEHRMLQHDYHWSFNSSPLWNWAEIDYRIAPKVPRRIWVNIYAQECSYAYLNQERASISAGIECLGKAIEFVEVLKEEK